MVVSFDDGARGLRLRGGQRGGVGDLAMDFICQTRAISTPTSLKCHTFRFAAGTSGTVIRG